jgi:hypothetical protein
MTKLVIVIEGAPQEADVSFMLPKMASYFSA